MDDRELIIYKTAINDAREEILNMADKKLEERSPRDAVIVVECSQAIAKLIER